MCHITERYITQNYTQGFGRTEGNRVIKHVLWQIYHQVKSKEKYIYKEKLVTDQVHWF